jgi:tetratricopeptide (TPR) repeat protein
MWNPLWVAVALATAAPAPGPSPAPAATGLAGEPAEAGVDHLELAALLIRDGHHDRAARELDAIAAEAEALAAAGPAPAPPPAPPSAPKPSDTRATPPPPLELKRYFTLRGIIALHRKAHLEAAQVFERAIEFGQDDPTVPGWIAQCYVALAQWEAAVHAFGRVPADALAADPRLQLLRANALWRAGAEATSAGSDGTGLLAEAYAVLGGLLTTDPGLTEARRMLLALLAEAGLHRAAADVGLAWLEQPGVGLDDFLAAAEALGRASAHAEAAAILDRAMTRYPDDPRLMALQSKALLDRGQTYAAALMLERAAMMAPERALDAAEVYRRAGVFDRALRMNARVPDAKAKLRQRVGLLVELERFEEVAALGERVLRTGLGADDTVVYAMAFSAWQVGDFEEAEAWLRRITRADLFEKAAALRKSMAICAAEPERCP